MDLNSSPVNASIVNGSSIKSFGMVFSVLVGCVLGINRGVKRVPRYSASGTHKLFRVIPRLLGYVSAPVVRAVRLFKQTAAAMSSGGVGVARRVSKLTRQWATAMVGMLRQMRVRTSALASGIYGYISHRGMYLVALSHTGFSVVRHISRQALILVSSESLLSRWVSLGLVATTLPVAAAVRKTFRLITHTASALSGLVRWMPRQMAYWSQGVSLALRQVPKHLAYWTQQQSSLLVVVFSTQVAALFLTLNTVWVPAKQRLLLLPAKVRASLVGATKRTVMVPLHQRLSQVGAVSRHLSVVIKNRITTLIKGS